MLVQWPVIVVPPGPSELHVPRYIVVGVAVHGSSLPRAERALCRSPLRTNAPSQRPVLAVRTVERTDAVLQRGLPQELHFPGHVQRVVVHHQLADIRWQAPASRTSHNLSISRVRPGHGRHEGKGKPPKQAPLQRLLWRHMAPRTGYDPYCGKLAIPATRVRGCGGASTTHKMCFFTYLLSKLVASRPPSSRTVNIWVNH